MGEGGRTGTNEKDDNRLPVVGDLITGSRECVNEREGRRVGGIVGEFSGDKSDIPERRKWKCLG